jgi:DNA-binding MarR family transcriptional regulator
LVTFKISKAITLRSNGHPGAAAARQATELLELFYPLHYRGNVAVEDAMRGELTRKQAAILWLIRSEAEISGGMRRKDIFRKLQELFEITSPAVTKALRGMMRPPLVLVRLVENAESGREKMVFLTVKGERFLATMIARGHEFLRQLVEQTATELSSEEVDSGIRFLQAAVRGYEQLRNGKAARSKGRRVSLSLHLALASLASKEDSSIVK